MKKFIILFSALFMMLSLAACTNKSDVPPPSGEGEGGSAISTPLEDNGQGTDATAVTSSVPTKAPVYKEYIYPYMGFSYVLPQELRDMLQRGEAWTSYDVQWKEEGADYDYAMMYFRLCEKDNPAKEIYDTTEEYETWLATTKLFGSITVVKSEYLKDNKIEDITKCNENKEIGKSSDGKYVFYFSTNEVNEVTELFKKTEVTTTDPTEIPKNACIRIYDGPHKQ